MGLTYRDCPVCHTEEAIALWEEEPMLEEEERAVYDLWENTAFAAQRIIEEELAKTPFTLEQFYSDLRTSQIVKCRRAVMVRLQNELKYGVTLIGTTIKRDHSTVVNGLKKEKEWLGKAKRRSIYAKKIVA